MASASAIEQLRRDLESREVQWDQMNALGKVVGTLNMRLKHETLVPLGPLAFLPAKLVSTNEVLVDLGGGFYVWLSCFEAHSLLTRKQGKLVGEMEDLKRRIAEMEEELNWRDEDVGEKQEEKRENENHRLGMIKEEEEKGEDEIKEFRLSMEEAEAFHAACRAESGAEGKSAKLSQEEHNKVMKVFAELALEESGMPGENAQDVETTDSDMTPIGQSGEQQDRKTALPNASRPTTTTSSTPGVVGDIIERTPPSVPSTFAGSSATSDSQPASTTEGKPKRVSLFKQKLKGQGNN